MKLFLLVSCLIAIASAVTFTCTSTQLSTQGWAGMGRSASAATFTQDSQTVVFMATNGAVGINNLFSVPAAGGDPVRLNVPHSDAASTVASYKISTNAGQTHVAYQTNSDEVTSQELYTVPIKGPASMSIKLNEVKMGGVTRRYEFSPNGGPRIVWDGTFKLNVPAHELYSAPFDGAGLPGTRFTLNKVGTVATQEVEPVWTFTTFPVGSERVIYTGFLETQGTTEIFAASLIAADTQIILNPVKGAAAPVGAPLTRFGPCGTTGAASSAQNVVFQGAFGNTADTQIYVANPLGATNNGKRVSHDSSGAMFPAGQSPAGYLCAAGGQRIIFWGQGEVAGRQDVYATTFQDDANIKRLSKSTSATGMVIGTPRLSGDGARLLFIGTHDPQGNPAPGTATNDLWTCIITQADDMDTTRVNVYPTPGGGNGNVVSWQVSPNFAQVAFLAQQTTTFEHLFTAPIAGGANVHRNPLKDAAVDGYGWLSDSSQLLFTGKFNPAALTVTRELYVTTNTANTATRLSGDGAMNPTREVDAGSFQELTTTPKRVLFTGTLSINGVKELYTTVLSTVDAPLKVNIPLNQGQNVVQSAQTVRVSPGAQDRCIFETTGFGQTIVYSGFTDASAEAQRVSKAPERFGAAMPTASASQISPDWNKVLYLGQLIDETINDLWISCTRSGPPPPAPTAVPTTGPPTTVPTRSPTVVGGTRGPTKAPVVTTTAGTTAATTGATTGATASGAATLAVTVGALLVLLF